MSADDRDWLVIEFDGEQDPIWTSGPLTEDAARERFDYVTRRRSQRSDVVIRARSAGLAHRGRLVDARRCGSRGGRRCSATRR